MNNKEIKPGMLVYIKGRGLCQHGEQEAFEKTGDPALDEHLTMMNIFKNFDLKDYEGWFLCTAVYEGVDGTLFVRFLSEDGITEAPKSLVKDVKENEF